MSGLTAKPDRPCFYLKTTLRVEAARGDGEKKGIGGGGKGFWKGFFSQISSRSSSRRGRNDSGGGGGGGVDVGGGGGVRRGV